MLFDVFCFNHKVDNSLKIILSSLILIPLAVLSSARDKQFPILISACTVFTIGLMITTFVLHCHAETKTKYGHI